MENVYWTTRDGTKINIDDMDLNHLRNTLKMIIRNNNTKKLKSFISHEERVYLNAIAEDAQGFDPNWD